MLNNSCVLNVCLFFLKKKKKDLVKKLALKSCGHSCLCGWP